MRTLPAPTYLFACILLGGSAQSILGLAVLQGGAILLLAWALFASEKGTRARHSVPIGLLALLVLVFVLQLVPLPPGFWTALPGRGEVGEGYALLDQPLPWLPISLAPYATLEAALALLPPAAILVVLRRVPDQSERALAWAVIAGAAVALLLGAVQVVKGWDPGAWYYPYAVSNTGAVGTFANRNHMGTVLLAAFPLAAALLFVARRDRAPMLAGPAGLVAAAIGGAMLIALLAINGSTAVAALALPVAVASFLLSPAGWRRRRIVAPIAALAVAALIGLFASTPVIGDLTGSERTSVDTRREIWGRTIGMAADHFPFGSGFGTFAAAYRLGDDPAGVTTTYVNHAHNDYLEALAEGGALALVLLLGFLGWWLRRARHIWTSALSTGFQRAATVATGAILLHSLVDYPLRTAAMAAVFAAGVAMMSRSRAASRGTEPLAERPVRHLVIG